MCLHLQAGSDLCPRRRDRKRDAIGQAAAIWPRAANSLATRKRSVGESSSNQRTELLPESDSTGKRALLSRILLCARCDTGQWPTGAGSVFSSSVLEAPISPPNGSTASRRKFSFGQVGTSSGQLLQSFFFRWSVVAERGLTSEGALHTKFESERARRAVLHLSASQFSTLCAAAIEAQDRERHFSLFRRACREDGESQQGSEARPASRCLPAC